MDENERETRTELLTRWAGHVLLDELQQAEMRALVWAHLEARLSSQLALSRTLGIRPYRLARFLAGTYLDDADWEAVAKWCEGQPQPSVAPETVALGVLARFAPESRSKAVREAIAAAVLAVYKANRVRVPPWTVEALTVL